MKIKRSELNNIIKGIAMYDEQKVQNFRLTLLLVKNKKLIDTEIEVFEEAKKKMLPTAEIEKFNKERMDIARNYWKKDDEGNYVMHESNGQAVHELINKAELQGKLEGLAEKYKTVLEQNDNGIKQAEAYLQEEIDIGFHRITDPEHIKCFEPKVLAALAPLLGCKISEKLLSEKGSSIKTSELERILEWCEIEK